MRFIYRHSTVKLRPPRVVLYLLLFVVLSSGNFRGSTTAGLSCAGISTVIPANPIQNMFRLERGQTFSKEFKGQDESTFQISLKQDQYAYIVVTQRGVDVAITILDRDQK